MTETTPAGATAAPTLPAALRLGAVHITVTDLTAGEIAHRAGFADPLYFSRAFKRHTGEPPMAYRAAVRGKSMHR